MSFSTFRTQIGESGADVAEVVARPDAVKALAVDNTGVIPGVPSSMPVVTRYDKASATVTTNGNTDALDSLGFGCLTYETHVTAISGSGATFQVTIESSEDTTNWNEFSNTRRFTAISSQRHQRVALGARYYRFSWVLTGSSPSVTFEIVTTLKPYLPNRNVMMSKYQDVIIDSTSNVSSVFTAADVSNVSLMTTRSDDGGSNCSYVIQTSNNNTNWINVTGNLTQARDTQLQTEFSNKAARFYRVKIVSAANVANGLDLFWTAGG